jgi:hypothetical protein
MINFFRRLFSKEPRHPWRAIRFHGGGIISSPFDMTESEAIMWVANAIKGEVAFVDREAGFIFYRPKE